MELKAGEIIRDDIVIGKHKDVFKKFINKTGTNRIVVFATHKGVPICKVSPVHVITMDNKVRVVECKGDECRLCEASNKERAEAFKKITELRESGTLSDNDRRIEEGKIINNRIISPTYYNYEFIIDEVEIGTDGTLMKDQIQFITFSDTMVSMKIEPAIMPFVAENHKRKNPTCMISVPNRESLYYAVREMSVSPYYAKGSWYGKVSAKLRRVRRYEKKLGSQYKIPNDLLNEIIEASENKVNSKT